MLECRMVSLVSLYAISSSVGPLVSGYKKNIVVVSTTSQTCES
jgi:hypothetical protein